MGPQGALYSVIAFVLVDVMAALMFFAYTRVHRLFSATPVVPTGIEVSISAGLSNDGMDTSSFGSLDEASEAHEPREAGHESASDDDKKQPTKVKRGEISLHMDKYSMVLREERMIRRHHEQSASEADTIHEDIEELPEDVEEGPSRGCTVDGTGERDTDTLEHTHIMVPYPGHELGTQSNLNRRAVPIFCAICLAEFAASETISWASNSQCTHVFHRKCITGWLARLLKTKGMQREKPWPPVDVQCPMCRQDFLQLTRGEESV